MILLKGAQLEVKQFQPAGDEMCFVYKKRPLFLLLHSSKFEKS
jgi:hypothetical protein